MKQASAILFFLLLLTSITAQVKRALIVAIGNYPEQNGWAKISSKNDVDYIKSTLGRQGFENENIKIVLDAEATHTGITNALNNLISDANSGDIVVIHFSSHGEQIEDDNGDETDGLDETIVTYNAVYKKTSQDFKKDQGEYLRDDEFGDAIDKLRIKIGKNGDVIVFMDLCHSGTGSRGNAAVRGDKPPMVSPTFDFNKFSGKTDSSVFRERPGTRGGENSLATYVVFSAARAEELDQEMINNDDGLGIHMGPLSYAISKVFETLDPGTTYRSLFSKIQSVMDAKVPGQHAVLEGNGIDRALFGGKSVYQKPYVEIESINRQEIVVKAGLLSGLDTGAKVAVYTAGSIDPAKAIPLATGRVIKAGSFTATIILDKDPNLTQAASGWVFVTDPVYNIKPINISIVFNNGRSATKGFSEAEITNIKQGLKELPLIKFDGIPDLIIAKGIKNDSLIVASNGYLYKTVNNISSNIENLKEELKQYTQYTFLKGLEVKDPDIHIEVKLVPVINGVPDTTKINSKVVNGLYEYSEGDKLVIWVKNTGTHPFYFNVLDMQPDGIINAALPKRSKKVYADDLKIDGGGHNLKYTLSITPPYGMEIFKIFASEEEINLEDIAAGRGQESRGNLAGLEKLVKNSYGLATRGVGDIENISSANGSVSNLLFRIIPKKQDSK